MHRKASTFRSIVGSRWNKITWSSRSTHGTVHELRQQIQVFPSLYFSSLNSNGTDFCTRNKLFYLTVHAAKFSLDKEVNYPNSTLRHELCSRRGYSSNVNQYDWGEERKHILSAALTFVEEFGWTDHAIAEGVLACGYPPSMIGLVRLSGNSSCHPLIEYYMNEANRRLRHQLLDPTFEEQLPTFSSKQERLIYAIRTRLLMNDVYLKCKRWTEGMALGIIYPSNAATTSLQLEEMLEIIYRFSSQMPLSNPKDESLSSSPNSNSNDDQATSQVNRFVDKGSIVFLYVITELFMLTDQSEGYMNSWAFLTNKVHEVLSIQGTLPSHVSFLHGEQMKSMLRPEVAIAATAVVSSLGGALLSLLTPMTRIGVSSLAEVIVPQILSSISQINSSPIKTGRSIKSNEST